MCRPHSTITPAVVRRTANAVLARALPLAPHGRPGAPGVVSARRKAGTRYAFGYATAVLLHRGRRDPVGLVPVTDGSARPHAVVAALPGQGR